MATRAYLIASGQKVAAAATFCEGDDAILCAIDNHQERIRHETKILRDASCCADGDDTGINCRTGRHGACVLLGALGKTA